MRAGAGQRRGARSVVGLGGLVLAAAVLGCGAGGAPLDGGSLEAGADAISPVDGGAPADVSALDAGALDAGASTPDTGEPLDDASVPACVHATDLQAATEAELARQGISGVTLGITMPACTWLGAAGLADRATAREMVVGDRFRVASITKTFTAAVVLQLVGEGRIALTDRLTRWVAFPGGDAITIRHLLTHTSGIADYYSSPVVLARLGEVWTREQVIDVARAEPLAFAAGAREQYSNTNFFLLGMVIEAVTGRPYHEEVRTRLLAPLGLADTYVAGVEPPPGELAHGYEQVSGRFEDVTELVDPSLTWAAGGIVSSTPDLQRWTRELFAGSVLSDELRAAMLTPEPLPGGGVGTHGLGVSIQDLPRGLGRFYSHLGRLQGYYGMIGYLPDHDAVMVQLTNDSAGGPNPFMTEMWMVVGFL